MKIVTIIDLHKRIQRFLGKNWGHAKSEYKDVKKLDQINKWFWMGTSFQF